jgi:hypothetical protein
MEIIDTTTIDGLGNTWFGERINSNKINHRINKPVKK